MAGLREAGRGAKELEGKRAADLWSGEGWDRGGRSRGLRVKIDGGVCKH